MTAQSTPVTPLTSFEILDVLLTQPFHHQF